MTKPTQPPLTALAAAEQDHKKKLRFHRTQLDAAKLERQWMQIATIACKVCGATTITLQITTRLTEDPLAQYEIRVSGRKDLTTRSLTKAVARYNQL